MQREALTEMLLGWEEPKIKILRVPEKGNELGVFAREQLLPGTELGDYIGQLLGSDEVRKLPKDTGFRLEVAEDSGLYVDPIDPVTGNAKYCCLVHYLNEPCPGQKCNCAIFYDGETCRMYMRAVTVIEPEQELLVSYGGHFKRGYEVDSDVFQEDSEHWENMMQQSMAAARERGLDVGEVDTGEQPDLAIIPKETTDGEPVCVMCGREASAALGTIDTFGKKKQRAHRKCIKWSSEVCESASGELVNAESAIRRARRIKCSKCGQLGGSIGCGMPKCKRSYHYRCAKEAGALFSKKTHSLYCDQHRAHEQEDVNATAASNDGSAKRARAPTVATYTGDGKCAMRAFKEGHKHLELERPKLDSLWRRFQTTCKKQQILPVATANVQKIEARSVNYLGSWWPAVVLGSSPVPDHDHDAFLVRYDGYDNELDEWLLFDAVREPTELIETLKEIPKAGSRVSIFCNDDQWRDARVEFLDLPKSSLRVKFCEDAGELGGSVVTITEGLIDKVSLYAQPFEFDEQIVAEGLLAAKHTELSTGKKHCAGLDPSCPATEPLDMHAQPSGPHCTELETMDLLIGMEDGWLFKDPVDPVALAIPDYFSIVKFPMDFTTIKAKLTSGAYAGLVDWATDVRLVFNNAIVYNGASHDVSLIAKKMLSWFERRVTELPPTEETPAAEAKQVPIEVEQVPIEVEQVPIVVEQVPVVVEQVPITQPVIPQVDPLFQTQQIESSFGGGFIAAPPVAATLSMAVTRTESMNALPIPMLPFSMAD